MTIYRFQSNRYRTQLEGARRRFPLTSFEDFFKLFFSKGTMKLNLRGLGIKFSDMGGPIMVGSDANKN